MLTTKKNNFGLLVLFITSIMLWTIQAKAEPSLKTDQFVCEEIIKPRIPEWRDEDGAWVSTYLTEARNRGLTEIQCARLVGRFTERQLRSKSRKAKVPTESIFNQTSKMKSELGKVKETLANIINNASGETQKENKKTIASLDQKIVNLNKRMASIDKKIKLIESKTKNTAVNSDTVLNNIVEWQKIIPRLDRTVKRINGEIKKINPKNQNEGFDEELRKLQSSVSANRQLLADWQTEISNIKRAAQANRADTNSNKDAPSSSSVEAQNSEILIWGIPILLLIGSFVAIIIVLIRKNNKIKRELEDNRRYDNRRRTPQAQSSQEKSSKDD